MYSFYLVKLGDHVFIGQGAVVEAALVGNYVRAGAGFCYCTLPPNPFAPPCAEMLCVMARDGGRVTAGYGGWNDCSIAKGWERDGNWNGYAIVKGWERDEKWKGWRRFQTRTG